MRVIEQDGVDPRLPGILRELERRLSGVPALAELTVNAHIDATFDGRSEKRHIRRSPAMYQKSTNTILINASLFWAKPTDVQVAVLAHEAAHALLHLQDAERDRDCIDADMLACRWGFTEPLVRDREPEYGKSYAEPLQRVGVDGDEEVRRSLEAALTARLNEWAAKGR